MLSKMRREELNPGLPAKWDQLFENRLTQADFYDDLYRPREDFLVPGGAHYPNLYSMVERMNVLHRQLKRGGGGEWRVSHRKDGSRVVRLVKPAVSGGGQAEKWKVVKTSGAPKLPVNGMVKNRKENGGASTTKTETRSVGNRNVLVGRPSGRKVTNNGRGVGGRSQPISGQGQGQRYREVKFQTDLHQEENFEPYSKAELERIKQEKEEFMRYLREVTEEREDLKTAKQKVGSKEGRKPSSSKGVRVADSSEGVSTGSVLVGCTEGRSYEESTGDDQRANHSAGRRTSDVTDHSRDTTSLEEKFKRLVAQQMKAQVPELMLNVLQCSTEHQEPQSCVGQGDWQQGTHIDKNQDSGPAEEIVPLNGVPIPKILQHPLPQYLRKLCCLDDDKVQYNKEYYLRRDEERLGEFIKQNEFVRLKPGPRRFPADDLDGRPHPGRKLKSKKKVSSSPEKQKKSGGRGGAGSTERVITSYQTLSPGEVGGVSAGTRRRAPRIKFAETRGRSALAAPTEAGHGSKPRAKRESAPNSKNTARKDLTSGYERSTKNTSKNYDFDTRSVSKDSRANSKSEKAKRMPLKSSYRGKTMLSDPRVGRSTYEDFMADSVRRLQSSTAHPVVRRRVPAVTSTLESSSAINRRRRGREITRENLRMDRQLNKPRKDMISFRTTPVDRLPFQLIQRRLAKTS